MILSWKKEMIHMKLKTLEFACFLALILSVCLSLLSFEENCKDVRADCLRFHIIANSDSTEDQELKLKVRDDLLENTAVLFEKAESKSEALELCRNNEDVIKEYVQKVIKEHGYNYTVEVKTGKAFFPTRTYEKYTLPAGKYDALKVIIGEGEGKNWWCVMFPSLCLPTSVKKNNISDVLTEEEINLIEKNPKYEIRFWIVEKIQKLKNNRIDTKS